MDLEPITKEELIETQSKELLKSQLEKIEIICPTCKEKITDENAVMHHNCVEK